MDLFLQLMLNGLFAGSHYALLGVGFGLIFGTTGISHFAYGPIYVAACFMIWGLASGLGLPYPLAVAVGVLLTALLGMATFYGLYQPFLRRQSPPFVVMVASLGFFIVLTNLLGIVFGTDAKTVPQVTYDIYFMGDIAVSTVQILQLAALIAVTALLFTFLKFTTYGNAIRAMANNIEMARIVGIDTDKVAMLTFAIGSAVSAVAGALILVKDGALPGMGFSAIFIAFVCVVIGGVGSITGAVLGGLLLGIAENLAIWRMPSEWQSTISFLVLFTILLYRPTGLLKGT